MQDDYSKLVTPTDEYPYREIITRAMAEGAIEGEAADYEVTSGFDTNFVFSRWNRTNALLPRDVSKLTGIKRLRGVKGPFWQGMSSAVSPALLNAIRRVLRKIVERDQRFELLSLSGVAHVQDGDDKVEHM